MIRRDKLARLAAVMLLVVVAFTFSVADTFALSGGTKKMTVYNKVIKKGNYAYCVNDMKGVYKVNVKTNKAKRIAKAPVAEYTYVRWMTLHKGYIYYVDRWDLRAKLYRVKTNGKNKKCLGWVSEYAIKNNTIYYKLYDEYGESYENMEMNLNGTRKRHSGSAVKMKEKKANVSSYKRYLKNVR